MHSFPLSLIIYCISKKEVSETFEILVLILAIFSKNSPKFPKNFLKIFKVFKHRKNYHFCTQISPKSLYRSFLANFFIKLQKLLFSLETSYFAKFSAPSAPKICSFGTQNPRFFVVRAPWRQGPP